MERPQGVPKSSYYATTNFLHPRSVWALRIVGTSAGVNMCRGWRNAE
jgi:hypothetical protein